MVLIGATSSRWWPCIPKVCDVTLHTRASTRRHAAARSDFTFCPSCTCQRWVMTYAVLDRLACVQRADTLCCCQPPYRAKTCHEMKSRWSRNLVTALCLPIDVLFNIFYERKTYDSSFGFVCYVPFCYAHSFFRYAAVMTYGAPNGRKLMGTILVSTSTRPYTTTEGVAQRVCDRCRTCGFDDLLQLPCYAAWHPDFNIVLKSAPGKTGIKSAGW